LQDHEIGSVLRVGCAFHVELAPRTRLRADAVVAPYLSAPKRWQTCSVTGSKGEPAYAWAWVATIRARHFLLIRKHLETGELAYHYCSVVFAHSKSSSTGQRRHRRPGQNLLADTDPADPAR